MIGRSVPPFRIEKAGVCRPFFLGSLALLFAVNSAFGQLPKAPSNLDFEERGERGGVSPWIAGPNQAHYSIALDNTQAFTGRNSLTIRSHSTPSDDEFGTVLQTFDATPYRGKQVLFRAAVRSSAKDSGATHLWLRVDRPEKQTGFFSEKTDKPIKSAQWGEYQILGYVAPDATQIVIGCFFSGEGEVGLDAVQFNSMEPGTFAADGLPEILSTIAPDGTIYPVKVADIWDVSFVRGEMVVLLKGGKGQLRAIGDYSWFEKAFHAR